MFTGMFFAVVLLTGSRGRMTRGHSLNGMSFTTCDRDNDRRSGNCAVYDQGAW